MSYDLYFTGRKISSEEFTGYFSSRKHYKGAAPQVIYENPDTGVYFLFEHNSENEQREPEEPEGNVSFNLNYIRPHIFALEAEPEVRALVEEFSFTIFDPQTHGMGTGSYGTEGFINGWNAGNKFGVKAILKQQPGQLFTYPDDKLEKIWKWNYRKEQLQQQLAEDIFVPGISFLQKDGSAVTFIVWGDAIPTLIPEVDYIFVVREELGPKGLFGGNNKRDFCLVPFKEAGSALGPYLNHDFELPAYKLPVPTSPEEIRQYVRKLKPLTEKLQRVSVDKVLGRQLVDESR